MNEELNYSQIAAAVYQACNSYDPYLPQLSVDMAKAWGKAFSKHKLTLKQLIAGVDRVYLEHGSGYRPLPKDIIDAARAIRREADEKSGPTDHYRDICDAKAGDREALARIQARTGQVLVGKELT